MRTFLIALAALLGVTAPAMAQANPCLTNTETAAKFRSIASSAFRFTDSAATVSGGYPWARLANIQLVTDSTVCAAGVAAWNARDGVQPISAAYVFALGGTGYALMWANGSGGRQAIYVFSPTWVFKIAYLG